MTLVVGDPSASGLTVWRRLVAMVPVLVALLVGCDSGETVGPTTRALPAGVVARVGQLDISATTVAAIAQEQDIALEQARDRAVYDALLASGAKADLAPRVVADAEARVLARALLRSLWRAAQQDPITAAELAEAKERHWTELDRPVGYRAVHALVAADDKANDEHHRQARALALRIREAVAPATEVARQQPVPERTEAETFEIGTGPPDPAAEAFIAAAKEVSEEGLQVRAEALHPVSADRHPIQRGTARGSGTYDAAFTAATVTLGARGELSDVVKTAFGYHVIMLLEITPAKQASQQECLARTKDEILKLRARRERDELLDRLRKVSGAAAATNADALLAQVPVVEQTEVAEAAAP